MTTSGTGFQVLDEVQNAHQGTASQTTLALPVFLVSLALSAQYSTFATAFSDATFDAASTQPTFVVSERQPDLLQELVSFHQRLAVSQRDLPDEAANVLRQNLWELYD